LVAALRDFFQESHAEGVVLEETVQGRADVAAVVHPLAAVDAAVMDLVASNVMVEGCHAMPTDDLRRFEHGACVQPGEAGNCATARLDLVCDAATHHLVAGAHAEHD